MKYNELTVVSPRIHNLGDFAHCLPMLSGFVKEYGQVSFAICPRLKRFKGLKEMLMYQGLFKNVWFYGDEQLLQPYILIDDSGTDNGAVGESLISRRYYNFVRNAYKMDFEFDHEFILKVPEISSDDDNTHIVGDRWSPSDAEDVDDRRKSNIIKNSNVTDGINTSYLDYNQTLLHNLSLIKHNKNPFISNFTGIAVLSDLMKKDTIILWDDEMGKWQGNSIDYEFKQHFFPSRNCRLVHIEDFKHDNIN